MGNHQLSSLKTVSSLLRIGIVILLLFLSVEDSKAQSVDSTCHFCLPAPDTTHTKTLSLWATYYYVPTVAHDSSGITLRDITGKSLGYKLTPEDWCRAAIEGTVFVSKHGETRALNYAGRSDSLQYDCRQLSRYRHYAGYERTGTVLWTETTGYGKGVRNYQLVPFRSVAVDSRKIPYGSILYIPAASGAIFIDENGITQQHDGYFFAADTGSAIKGDHIDVFLGTQPQQAFSFIQSDSTARFAAYLITNDKIQANLQN
ncbi:MAG: 3D domain-containing protein, partial [Cyclobacteriaceae bacterium]